MKRMICYFLLCALILACIAGCISGDPGENTEPSGSASLESPTNGEGTQQTESGFTVPTYELEPLPTIDREKTGPLVEYDPDRELYILASTNSIIYPMNWSNNSYSFRIFSKKPLDVDSISVKVPISFPYEVSVREREPGGTEELEGDSRLDYDVYKNKESFMYSTYLAYLGKDFWELSELISNQKQLLAWFSHYATLYEDELTFEEYTILKQPYTDAVQAYEDYLNADWEAYLALTKADLPQFYVYGVSIRFDDFAEFVQEESFTQIEITIGDQTYVQDVGQVTLIEDWDLPAPIDWTVGYGGLDGIIGGRYTLQPYNDGVICINSYFHFTADCYKLLEELVLLNPTLKVERVWLCVRPKGGKTIVEEWDMLEPYEIYPGDEVTVYVAISDPNLDDPGYQTMIDGYLLYSTDGEQYLKFSNCYVGQAGSDYFWNAVLFDGIDMEGYYWDYYYLNEEPWRYDPEANPAPPIW